jgi:syntaxin 5
MPDRTSYFVTLASRRRASLGEAKQSDAAAGAPSKVSKRPRTQTAVHQDANHLSFLRGSEYVANQLDALGREVDAFAHQSRNHSVFGSDVEQEMGVQTAQLQAQFTRIHEGLQALDRLRTACSTSRRQGQLTQHRAQVMSSQQVRVKRLAQIFQDTVQQRAKALSQREETLKGMFGHAGVRGGGQGAQQPMRDSTSGDGATPSPRERGTLRSTTSALSNMPSSSNSPVASFANNRPGQQSQNGMTTSRGVSAQPPPFAPAANRFAGKAGGATLRQRRAPAGPSFAPAPSAHDTMQQHQHPNQQQQQHQHQQQQQQSNSGQAYQQERGQEVFQMEKQVSQLNELMIEFTRMVTLQGETVQNIAGALDETDLNVEKGRVELGKYFDNISGNRQLIIKIFITLIVISMLFIVLW